MAEACAPDADRAGPDAFPLLPEWLRDVVARLILFLLNQLRAGRPHRSRRRSPRWVALVAELGRGRAQPAAPSICGPIAQVVATVCAYWGIGPGHRDWPELSRLIIAFGGTLAGLNGHRYPQPWLEAPQFVPGMIRADAAAKPTAASLLLAQVAADVSQSAADIPWPVAIALPAGPGRVLPSAPRVSSPAPGPRGFARAAATGPPTGPPAGRNSQLCHV
jgi:hypothetical protein